MQSGYGGGVSQIQQFMVDNCGAALFPISSANPAPAADMHLAAPHPLKYHPHHHHHHHPLQPPGLPPHLAHFHSIPITQQLFHQPAAACHQFQLFHPQQQYLPEPRRVAPLHQFALHQESAPENSASPTRIIPGGGGGGGGPSFLSAAMSFKLGVNDNSGGGRSRDAMNDDDGILQGDDVSESRHHRWQREDDSAIKELPWRPLDIDYINRNNKRCNKDKEPNTSNPKYPKKSKGVAATDHDDVGGISSNYKIFSELEAIYKPGGSIVAAAGQPSNNQTGSGSALTGDEVPLLHGVHAAAVAAPVLPIDADRTSETSAEEEARTAPNKSSKSSERRRPKRQHRHVTAVAAFLESLVKQLMDHQEGLHRRFLELMERREQESADREEAWRKQEAANSARESAARAQERAHASSREAAIVAFIEKITGETLNLPPKPQFPSADANVPKEHNLQIETYDPDNQINNNNSKVAFNTSRWPKAEVQALIRVRSGLESRFQEPGLKGPLWEEVSAAMVAMGFHRSAKRCKEKWENINKYFRKTKEKGKKRPQHSKTCPYFQQLDQLYSKSLISKPSTNASSVNDQPINDNSELLDAIVVPADQQNFNFMGKEEEGDEERGAEEGKGKGKTMAMKTMNCMIQASSWSASNPEEIH